MSDQTPMLASKPERLIAELLDPFIPKNEREHAAAAEIDRLRARVAELDRECEAAQRLHDRHGKRIIALGTRVAELEAALRKAIGLMQEVRIGHRSPGDQDYNECEQQECYWCAQSIEVEETLEPKA